MYASEGVVEGIRMRACARVCVCVCVWGWVHERGRVLARVDLRIQYAMRKRLIVFVLSDCTIFFDINS